MEVFSSQRQQGASAAGLQMGLQGQRLPSVSAQPWLRRCALLPCGAYPFPGQAGQGTLCASLLASGPAHTVLFGSGAGHFPALSDPVLLWELGMVQVAWGSHERGQSQLYGCPLWFISLIT